MTPRMFATRIFVVIGILTISMLSESSAVASQATASDITDFIKNSGGWFYSTDLSHPGDTLNHYWVQRSYTITPAAGSSSIVTIAVVQGEQKVNRSTGAPPPCSTTQPATETVTLDLRVLQSATTISGPTVSGPLQIWSVGLLVSGGKPLIRVIKGASAPGCPPAGGTNDISTQQSDVNTYAIQFANQDQAKYFQMLIASAVPAFNPPMINGAS